MSSGITVTLDQKALKRAKTTLAKYQGAPLAERLRRGALQASRILAPSIRAEAPKGATGNLKASVKARPGNYGLAGVVGPTGRKGAHRHLVIRGHRIVTPGGRDTGRRTTGNAFVDRAVTPRVDDAVRAVRDILFEE